MAEQKGRENFTQDTIQTAAQRAAYLCSKPDCRCLTTTAALGKGVDRIGEAAHIIAAAADGPRGQEPLEKYGIPSLTSQENALWMCSIHHTQIDRHPEQYPVATLLTWKADIEAFTRQHLGRSIIGAQPAGYTPPLLPDPTELPERAALPPGSHLPLRPNQAFTGRQAELLWLGHGLLYAPQNRPTAIVPPAALAGSGGIGKTQLAVEFCYRYGQFFYGVHWLQADQPLEAQMAACGEKMGLRPWPETLPEQAALTRQAWDRQPHRLVVLDNLENPSLLLEIPEELRACKLLVTSRRAAYDPTLGVHSRPLELLPRSDSLALLRSLSPRLAKLPDRDIAPLADRLGDYPLALHLAGMYLELDKMSTPAAYLKKLDAPGGALGQEFLAAWKQTNPTHYERNAGEAFRLSWEQLRAEDPLDLLAQRFFLSCGYCAANTPIPYRLFAGLSGQETDSLACSTALDRLQALGLVVPAEAGPMLHPLLAEFARLQDAQSAQSSLAGLVNALAQASYQASELGAVSGYLPLLPHLRQAGQHCRLRYPEQAALMDNNLGYLLDSMGDYPAARPYYEQALAIRKEVLGEQHPATASSLNNLGYLLYSMGDYPAARPYLEQALAIRKEALGEQHPATASSLNNLGGMLKAMGETTAARPYYEQALAINREALGEHHPATASSLNNLGTLLQAMGETTAARPYYEQALAIDRKALGEQHPDTASSLNNLGMLLKAMGDYDAARPYLEQALAINKEALGEHHRDTARSLNNLGGLLQAMGDYDAARPYLEQALAIRKEALGEQHPATALCLNNLGILLGSMGETAAARPYLEQALAILNASLGPGHPTTNLVRTNLASLPKP